MPCCVLEYSLSKNLILINTYHISAISKVICKIMMETGIDPGVVSVSFCQHLSYLNGYVPVNVCLVYFNVYAYACAYVYVYLMCMCTCSVYMYMCICLHYAEL